MSRSCLAVCLLVLSGGCCLAQEAPRGAGMYSAFQNGGYWYRDCLDAVFAEAGVSLDSYENTRVAELVASLDTYDVVVLGTGYNYENPQDLGAYGAAWQAFVERGGCLVVTDANYPQMSGWLTAVDPSLRWARLNEINPGMDAPPAWVDVEHPLMRGVKPPNVAWTRAAYWSQAYTPLVTDADRQPVVAFAELGRGSIVVSSAYRQHDFPNAAFLRNLLAWAKDPGRIQAALARAQAAEAALGQLPEVTIGHLAKAPALDGTVDAEEWSGAATLPEFVAMDGTRSLTQRTVCRLGQTDQGLYVAFECHDTAVSGVNRRITERDGAVWNDDCVEVFLDPTGGRGEYLHFAVSAAGTQYDERGADPSWDRWWTARTAVSPGMWTAELFIPFAALDIRADGAPAQTWTGNFYREFPGHGGVPMELSGWSPTWSNFGASAHFGRLHGIAVPTDRYVLAPELNVRTPDRWFAGANPVTATVTGPSEAARQVRLALVDVGSDAPAAEGAVLDLAAGEVRELDLELVLETDSPRTLQAIATDAEEPERVLASSRVIRAEPMPVLELAMASPVFRKQVQSRDPDKTLRLVGSVGDPGVAEGELRLRASLIPQGLLRPVWQEAQVVAPRSEVRFERSLAEVAPGAYEVQIDLQDSAQRLIARDREALRVLPPAPVEVTFTQKRACLVNGKPLFPIGLYHVSEPALELINARGKELGLPQVTLEEMLKGVRDHGFNTVVRAWGMPGEDYMRIAQDLGLWVLPEVGAPDAASLTGMVDFANRYGNLLMWYGVDEPGGSRLQMALDAYARFAAADPHRPVSAACNNVGVFAEGVRAYDLLMMDPYIIFPKRSASLEPIAGWVEAGIAAGKGRVPIWVVPQAFAIDNVWGEPTAEELRCQAYLSIVHGATGLVWYAWFTTETWSQNPNGRNQWFLPDSPMWPAFTKLNGEINELAPVFLEGDVRGPAACDNDAIHARVWELGGVRTLIAVNPRMEAQACRISGLGAGTAQVLYEDREVALEGGVLSDSFAPLAVHVYRLR